MSYMHDLLVPAVIQGGLEFFLQFRVQGDLSSALAFHIQKPLVLESASAPVPSDPRNTWKTKKEEQRKPNKTCKRSEERSQKQPSS